MCGRPHFFNRDYPLELFFGPDDVDIGSDHDVGIVFERPTGYI